MRTTEQVYVTNGAGLHVPAEHNITRTTEQLYVTIQAGLHLPAEQAVSNLFFHVAEHATDSALEESIRAAALDDTEIDATVDRIARLWSYPKPTTIKQALVPESASLTIDLDTLGGTALKNVIFEGQRVDSINAFTRTPRFKAIQRSLGMIVNGRSLVPRWAKNYQQQMNRSNVISLSEDRQGE